MKKGLLDEALDTVGRRNTAKALARVRQVEQKFKLGGTEAKKKGWPHRCSHCKHWIAPAECPVCGTKIW